MNNLSDGKSDGIILMYVKDGIVYPVAISEEDLGMLDMSIGICLNRGIGIIKDKPMGELVELKGGSGKSIT